MLSGEQPERVHLLSDITNKAGIVAESWIAVTSDIIELENMQRGSVGSGGIEYTALDDAVVRAGGTSYSLPKGGQRLVVVGNTIHIPAEFR